MEAFNWEQHKHIMQDVIDFLEDHDLIPSKLNIRADGWTEAVFIIAEGESGTHQTWNQLEKQNRIELEEHLLEIDNKHNHPSLRVKFRVKQAQEQPIPQLSRWERLKQRFAS